MLRPQIPAQLTTVSQLISPCAVWTAATRPFSVRIPVTGVSSKTFNPWDFAPLISEAQMSLGLTRPSEGEKTAPIRSSLRINGHFSAALLTESSSAPIPKACERDACRRMCVRRS